MEDVRQQEAVALARQIKREEPLFLVQEIGWRVRDGSWALKVFDSITERQAVILDAGTWPRLRAVARSQQRRVLHPAFHEQDTADCKPSKVRRDKPLQMIS